MQDVSINLIWSKDGRDSSDFASIFFNFLKFYLIATGSRVLAFEFHKSYLNGRLVLDNELFKELKPGLSSMTPEKGALQISQLLEEAKKFIPEKYRRFGLFRKFDDENYF